jgi:hypothetical protein
MGTANELSAVASIVCCQEFSSAAWLRCTLLQSSWLYSDPFSDINILNPWEYFESFLAVVSTPKEWGSC